MGLIRIILFYDLIPLFKSIKKHSLNNISMNLTQIISCSKCKLPATLWCYTCEPNCAYCNNCKIHSIDVHIIGEKCEIHSLFDTHIMRDFNEHINIVRKGLCQDIKNCTTKDLTNLTYSETRLYNKIEEKEQMLQKIRLEIQNNWAQIKYVVDKRRAIENELKNALHKINNMSVRDIVEFKIVQ